MPKREAETPVTNTGQTEMTNSDECGIGRYVFFYSFTYFSVIYVEVLCIGTRICLHIHTC
jgi:hypothetical protein